MLGMRVRMHWPYSIARTAARASCHATLSWRTDSPLLYDLVLCLR